ncbi:O-antigen ligase family protein [Candidatus Omnitrophota bacterium]
MLIRTLDSLLLLLICLRPLISYPGSTAVDLLSNSLFILLNIAYFYARGKTKKTGYDPLFFIFILSLLFSFLLGPDVSKNLPFLLVYLFYLSLFYFSYFEQGKKYYPAILFLGTILVCLYAARTYFIISGYTLDYITQRGLDDSFAKEFLLRRRAFSPFVLPSLLGGYLAMIIPLCGGVILEKNKKKERDFILILAIATFVLAFFSLFLTKSIGAWFSLIGALSAYVMIVKRASKKTVVVMLLIILILAAVFFFRLSGEDFTTPQFSLKKRLNYWSQTLEVIAAHPLKGTGIGNFSLSESRFAHNSYLQIWAEAGIVPFLSYLVIVLLFLKRGTRAVRDCANRYFSGFFIAGLVFIIHNLVDFTFFIPQVAFLWWISLGCVLAYPKGFYSTD